jgi:hypothetical protein
MGASRERALIHVPAPGPSAPVRAAEARASALLAEVDALERALEARARELAEFECSYVDATAAAFAELDLAQKLARRLSRLAEAASALVEELSEGPRSPRRSRQARPLPAGGARPGARRDARAEPKVPPPRPGGGDGAGARREVRGEPDLPDLDLKALYRRLARRLHPDLARGEEAERRRLSDLMARASDAYARRDWVELELLAERLGAGDLTGSPSDGERLAHLRRRTRALEQARARLEAEWARLLGGRTAALHREAARRTAEGGDFAGEARLAAERAAEDARAAARKQLDRLPAITVDLERARRGARARSPRRRDPVAASPLVRRELLPQDFRRVGPTARDLARRLEGDARGEAPWRSALTVLAFVCEATGRAPPPVGTRAGLEERWDALRAGWSDAPSLVRAIESLPGDVAVGLRHRGAEVEAGLHLASVELAPALHLALRHEEVRAVARRVLAALGPRERCAACAAEVYAVHLLRLSVLDEVHGLACPSCAGALRTYLRFGEPQGLEALWPMAVGLGLAVELPIRFMGARAALGMLPAERARLTARALSRLLTELALAPAGIALPRGALVARAGRAALAPGARVPEGGRVSVRLAPDAGIDEAEVLALLRASLARRFKE